MNIWDATKSGVVIIAVLAALFFGWKVQQSMAARQNLLDAMAKTNATMADSFIKLADNIAVRKVVVDTKALEEKLNEVDANILTLAKERGEVVDQLGKTAVTLKQVANLNIASSKKYLKGKVTDYEFIKIYTTDTDGKPYPVAWAMYHPNQVEGKRWKTGTYPLEIHEQLVYTKGDKSAHVSVEAWVENNKMKETKGKKFPVNVDSVEWYARTPTEKFQWWNPRISIGMMGTSDDLYPTFNFSTSSYGPSKGHMRWRFIVGGIGGNSDTGFVQVAPFEYNVGFHLPIIENLFFGPYVNWDFDEWQTSYGLGISVPF